MSIFAQLMGGSRQTEGTNPPAAAAAPGARHTPTQSLTGGSGVPPGTTPSPQMPQQGAHGQQQQQAPAPMQPQASNTISLADLLNSGPGDKPEDLQGFAQNFIQALQHGNPDLVADQMGQPARLDEQQLFQAFSQVDMTGNIDVNALLENMNGQDGPQHLRQAFQQSQLNTIMAMTPLVNQLVATAVERATQTAVRQSEHNLTSSAIINDFRQRYDYSANPVVSGMLENLAPTIAQSLPKGTPTAKVSELLHHVFSGISAATNDRRDGPASAPGVQMDFRGLFNK